MAKLISVGIDLSKIDKTKITEKNGAKWYNITISVNNEPDQFGNDTGVFQSQTKEERDRKDKKVYLGNGKTFWTDEKKSTTIEEVEAEMKAEKNAPKPVGEADDSLPF